MAEPKLVKGKYPSPRGEKKRAARKLHAVNLTIEPQSVIAKMTGWQRNQWARAGYDMDRVDRYARLSRTAAKVRRAIAPKISHAFESLQGAA